MRNQLIIVAGNIGREENLSPVLLRTNIGDMDEQFELAHKVKLVDRANKKNCKTMVRYNVEIAEGSFARGPNFWKKKEDEKFQQIFYVKDKLEEFICVLDAMNSVYNKVVINEPILNVL